MSPTHSRTHALTHSRTHALARRYEARPHLGYGDPNKDAFVTLSPRAAAEGEGEGEEDGGDDGGHLHRWLRTGDKGWLDERGHLHLTGRFKEVINREHSLTVCVLPSVCAAY